jgi:hypothetical protein
MNSLLVYLCRIRSNGKPDVNNTIFILSAALMRNFFRHILCFVVPIDRGPNSKLACISAGRGADITMGAGQIELAGPMAYHPPLYNNQPPPNIAEGILNFNVCVFP